MTQSMRAAVFHGTGGALELENVPIPDPQSGQVLIKVEACGVCRTDIHITDGELAHPKLPLVLGHQIVGRVQAVGADVASPRPGARVGVPWLASVCDACEFCRSGKENLCAAAEFTGYTVNGGFAEYAVARADFCFPVSADEDAVQIAPLLCAGLIGYRSLQFTGDAHRIGIYGFGSAAHIITQVSNSQHREIFAFTRDGDKRAQEFARELGVAWAGGSSEAAPVPLDAAIIFAPIGELVPAALRAVKPGGVVVCGGIHMSDIPSFPYSSLWQERKICSVANLTRRDGREFLPIAAAAGVKPMVTVYRLENANAALDDLRGGKIAGSAVIEVV